MSPLVSRLALNLAAGAMIFAPVCAQANTRASASSVAYQPAPGSPAPARNSVSRVDDDDELEGRVWIIGGVALAAIIAIAVSGGGGSGTRTPNQSNGAN